MEKLTKYQVWEMSVQELKVYCIQHGIKGYSKLNRYKLEQLVLNSNPHEVIRPQNLNCLTVHELRQMAELENIKNMSRARKQDLISALQYQQPGKIEIIEKVVPDFMGDVISNVNLQVQVQPESSKFFDGGTIRIKCGVEDENHELVGFSVEKVIEAISGLINVPENPTILVNGSKVGNDYITKKDDVLEIVKPARSKG